MPQRTVRHSVSSYGHVIMYHCRVQTFKARPRNGDPTFSSFLQIYCVLLLELRHSILRPGVRAHALKVDYFTLDARALLPQLLPHASISSGADHPGAEQNERTLEDKNGMSTVFPHSGTSTRRVSPPSRSGPKNLSRFSSRFELTSARWKAILPGASPGFAHPAIHLARRSSGSKGSFADIQASGWVCDSSAILGVAVPNTDSLRLM